MDASRPSSPSTLRTYLLLHAKSLANSMASALFRCKQVDAEHLVLGRIGAILKFIASCKAVRCRAVQLHNVPGHVKDHRVFAFSHPLIGTARARTLVL